MKNDFAKCDFHWLILSLLCCTAPLLAQPQQFVPNEVLVKFRANIQSAQVQTTLADAGLNANAYLSQIGVYHCSITTAQSVQAAVQACRQSPDVVYAEPNYIYAIPEMNSLPETPKDPRFHDLCGMQNNNDADIDAPQTSDDK